MTYRVEIVAEPVPAIDVPCEVFLPDLDHGYVFENTPADYPYNGEYYRAIGFHDANGDECYLIVPNEFMVMVKES